MKCILRVNSCEFRFCRNPPVSIERSLPACCASVNCIAARGLAYCHGLQPRRSLGKSLQEAIKGYGSRQSDFGGVKQRTEQAACFDRSSTRCQCRGGAGTSADRRMTMGNFVLTNNLDLNAGDNRAMQSRSLLVENETSIWSSLFSNLRDAVSPKKQPPLELTSRPVAVADPLAVKRGPASSFVSFITHAGVISLIAWLTLQTRTHIVLPQKVSVTPVDIKPFIPVTMPAAKAMGGGGGGGAHQIVEPSKGHLPKIEKTQVAPPQILKIDHPKLAVAPSVVIPQA